MVMDLDIGNGLMLQGNKQLPRPIWYFLAWRQTPETGSGVVAFTDLAAQLEMQNYIYWYTFCHL